MFTGWVQQFLFKIFGINEYTELIVNRVVY